jgi:hypothetical protein
MRSWLFFVAFIFLLCSCGEGEREGYRDLDLMAYNIPVTIEAPDSAEVISGSLSGVMDDITVRSPEERFNVQILASAAQTNDMTRLKADALELVRDNRYFSRIVREDPNGFIFENTIDGTSAYGFRYIVYQGDREIIFQNAFDGVFTLDEIENMYASVRTTTE